MAEERDASKRGPERNLVVYNLSTVTNTSRGFTMDRARGGKTRKGRGRLLLDSVEDGVGEKEGKETREGSEKDYPDRTGNESHSRLCLQGSKLQEIDFVACSYIVYHVGIHLVSALVASE